MVWGLNSRSSKECLLDFSRRDFSVAAVSLKVGCVPVPQ